MPEFVLDTSGRVECAVSFQPIGWAIWPDLDAFTAGYIEALFFTECAQGVTTEEWQGSAEHDEGSIPGDVGFADLAPETLARIIADCAKFQGSPDDEKAHTAWVVWREGAGLYADDETKAGRDFWYTRNGHGVGFWDGDWPEPYAAALTDAAEAFGPCDPYLGDDGKVYLS